MEIRTRLIHSCVIPQLTSNIIQLRIEGHFGSRTFLNNILKYGMNLKFETIVHIFSTSDRLLSDVLLLSKVRDFTVFYV